MSDREKLEILQRLEDLLIRKSVDITDPEIIGLIEDVAAEISAFEDASQRELSSSELI
jgi:hypothetical protein